MLGEVEIFKVEENKPGSTTDLGESELDAPDLTLVAETVLADSLQLSVAGCTLDI